MEPFTAYFDESGTHAGSPRLWLGGYIFHNNRGAEFALPLTNLLREAGPSHWHMTESPQTQQGKGIFGEYKGMPTWVLYAIYKDCIDAINQSATCGFFLSVSHDDTQLIQATAPGFNLSAYGFLCWNALICVRQRMDNAAFNGQAAYVFESGCYGYSEINKFMHGMFSKDHGQSLTEKFRYHSHTFQEKTTSPHLQAADVLVWHAQKQYSHMPNKPEGIRRDFEELLEVETLNFNFGRNSLLGLAKRYEKLGVQYAQEP